MVDFEKRLCALEEKMRGAAKRRQSLHDDLHLAHRLEGLGSRVRVYNNANTPIGDAAWATLTYNSERWDTEGTHSLTTNTGRLTCIIPGPYDIGSHTTFLANGVGYRGARILLNGTTTIAESWQINNGASINVSIPLATQYPLDVGDYVTLQVYQNRGGILNVMYYAQYSPEFMMARTG